MFLKIFTTLFVLKIFVYCDSAFVDTLTACPVNDPECHKNLLQGVLNDIGKTGIPDLGIPPTDPYALKNVSVSILDLLDIALVDGVLTGMKDCVVDKCQSYIEREHTTLEITCDVTIKGQYTVTAKSPLLENLLGKNSVHGDGYGKVSMKKLHLKAEYRFFPRLIDGEVFNEIPFETFKPTYKFGRITFAADNLYLGDQEASELLVGLLNSNAQIIMDIFGKPFFDVGTKIMYQEFHKFVEKVPAKYFVLEDLRPYIKA